MKKLIKLLYDFPFGYVLPLVLSVWEMRHGFNTVWLVVAVQSINLIFLSKLYASSQRDLTEWKEIALAGKLNKRILVEKMVALEKQGAVVSKDLQDGKIVVVHAAEGMTLAETQAAYNVILAELVVLKLAEKRN